MIVADILYTHYGRYGYTVCLVVAVVFIACWVPASLQVCWGQRDPWTPLPRVLGLEEFSAVKKLVELLGLPRIWLTVSTVSAIQNWHNAARGNLSLIRTNEGFAERNHRIEEVPSFDILQRPQSAASARYWKWLHRGFQMLVTAHMMSPQRLLGCTAHDRNLWAVRIL